MNKYFKCNLCESNALKLQDCIIRRNIVTLTLEITIIAKCISCDHQIQILINEPLFNK